jgi:predicted nucleic acid-binding protein
MRVFCDANVLFSAANAASPLHELIRLTAERHTLVTSTLALLEAQRNIAMKRPTGAATLAALVQSIEVVPSLDAAVPVAIAAKDRPILATAIHSGCDLLVTGDRRHFGHLFGHTAGGVAIISLRDLADKLVSEQDDAGKH